MAKKWEAESENATRHFKEMSTGCKLCVCVCIHGSKEICSILCIANLAIEKKERERKTALAESQAT